MNSTRHRSYFLPSMSLLVVAAWLILWIGSVSPYARYLDHGDWTRMGVVGSICTAVGAGNAPTIAFYLAGWLLMLVAMMLPTTLPLLEIYLRLTRWRRDRGLLLALAIAGYLVAWTLFGIAAHAVDWALHRVVDGSPWLAFNGWVFQAGVLAVAGGFQFSALKYRCLDKCRMPLGFVLEHWQSGSKARQAFHLGAVHGLFCVGCCWALMLLMFVVGSGNVGWMMVLGAIMAAERNLQWGRRLCAPLGIALLVLALATVAHGVDVA